MRAESAWEARGEGARRGIPRGERTGGHGKWATRPYVILRRARRNSKRNFWSVPTNFKTKFFGRQNEIQNEIPFKGIFQLKAAKTVMGLTKYYPFLLPPNGQNMFQKGIRDRFF